MEKKTLSLQVINYNAADIDVRHCTGLCRKKI